VLGRSVPGLKTDWRRFLGNTPLPPGFPDLFITKDFTINHFGSAHSKGVTGERNVDLWILKDLGCFGILTLNPIGEYTTVT
jgi:hypothetical protein